ncbi:MAG TPA: sulfotransferase [Streptosporangiaceae bacterium]|nr:sulfotransferase [Streptosporangiaceae bacterium]
MVTAGPRTAALSRTAHTQRSPDGKDQPGPVVILGCAQSGAARLQRVLAAYTALACTTGTGILPLCDLAAVTWRQAENRDGPLSALASASIRALTDSLITAILVSAGTSRWCEISFAPAHCAEAFLELYPATRFVCLHRACPDVITDAVRAHPWGLSGTPFEPHAATHPGSTTAAIAAYWATTTQALLRFQEAHPAACRRLKYEDLPGGIAAIAEDVAAFLGLGHPGPATPNRPAGQIPSPPEAAMATVGPAPAGAHMPTERIPAALRATINDLHAQLGYPPLT